MTLRCITITSILLGSSALSALEFGQMGNVSAGIGGAGVALRNSQWALYYNPALLAMSKRSGFAYSFGIGYKETNLSRAASIDIDNLTDMPNQLAKLFSSGSSGSSAFQSIVQSAGGVDELKKKPPAEIKDALLSSLGSDPLSAALLAGLITSVDPDNIGSLVDKFGNGTSGGGGGGGSSSPSDLPSLLSTLGSGISLQTGSDPSLNRFVTDMITLNEMINKNDFSLSTQNGVVFNIGSKKKRGTISLGIMPSAFISATAKIDPTHNQVIIKNNNQELKVTFTKDRITLTQSSGQFDSHSILSDQAKHQLHLSSIAIAEIPLGYGHLFETSLGDIALGLNAKYIFGTGYGYDKEGSFNTITKDINPTFDGIAQTHTFGIDAGLAYAPRFAKNLTLGFVAKNLNMPKIKTDAKTGAMIKLNTQIRAGVSYGWLNDKIVLAGDIDLMPNDTISLMRPKSQVAGGGILIDLKIIDLRLGAMYDFRNNGDEGMILTGGINLLGFFDIAVQSNLHLSHEIAGSGIAVPSYLLVKVGGGFSW